MLSLSKSGQFFLMGGSKISSSSQSPQHVDSSSSSVINSSVNSAQFQPPNTLSSQSECPTSPSVLIKPINSASSPELAQRSSSNNKKNKRSMAGEISSVVSGVTHRLSASFPSIMSNSSARESTQPSDPLDSKRLEIGLENLGNTCYANSTLQCLLHIVPLVRFFLDTDIKPHLNRSSPFKGEIAAYFSELVKSTHQASSGSYVSPLRFLCAVRNHAPHLVDNNQQDCQEFLRFILDGMCEDLCRKKSTNLTVDSRAPITSANLAMSPSSLRRLQMQQQQQLQAASQLAPLPLLMSPPLRHGNRSPAPISSGPVDKLRSITKLNNLPESPTRSKNVSNRISDNDVVNIGSPIGNNAGNLIISQITNDTERDNINSPVLALKMRNMKLNSDPVSTPADLRVPNQSSSDTIIPSSPASSPRKGRKVKARNRNPTRLPPVESASNDDQLQIVSESKQSAPYELTETDERKESSFYFSSSPRLRTSSTATQNDGAFGKALGSPKHAPSSQQNAVSEEADKAWAAYMKFNDSVISDMFAGQLQSTVECTVCHQRSFCFDPFLDISVPIPKINDSLGTSESKGFLGRRAREPTGPSQCSLEDCVEKFLGDEILDGENMVTCDTCHEKRRCVKRMSIFRLPRVLVVHIKRFRFNNHQHDKLLTDVNFPIQGFDLSSYISSDRFPSNCASLTTELPAIYDLCGVSNHAGNLSVGHYIAHIDTNAGVTTSNGLADSQLEARWMCFNDERVSLAQPVNIAGPSAYVLFYRQRGCYEQLSQTPLTATHPPCPAPCNEDKGDGKLKSAKANLSGILEQESLQSQSDSKSVLADLRVQQPVKLVPLQQVNIQ